MWEASVMSWLAQRSRSDFAGFAGEYDTFQRRGSTSTAESDVTSTGSEVTARARKATLPRGGVLPPETALNSMVTRPA